MIDKIVVPTISGRIFGIVSGIDLPRLIEGDILISYPYSQSPRRELVIHADNWHGTNKQSFVTASVKEENLEVKYYGLYRMFSNPTTKIKLNCADPKFVSYLEESIKEN